MERAVPAVASARLQYEQHEQQHHYQQKQQQQRLHGTRHLTDHEERLGNQKSAGERDVAPEQPDDDDDNGQADVKEDDDEEEDGEENDGEEVEGLEEVRRFSSSSASSSVSPLPSPEEFEQSTETEEAREYDRTSTAEENEYTPRVDPPNNSQEIDGTQHQQLQLQDDLEVLASHLQLQTRELERERSVNQSLQSHLQHLQHSLEREMESILIENDALRRQHTLIVSERDAALQRAQSASESHEELLGALRQQQQRDDHVRTIVAALVHERDALKKQLDESKVYCRRLEDDVVALRADQQHLQRENATLTSALHALSNQTGTRDLQVVQDQELLIESLRVDLVQMEFEFQTLRVDKDKLSHRVATLQRQSESRSTSYDVISLENKNKSGTTAQHTKKRLSGILGGGSNSNSSSSSSSRKQAKPRSDAESGFSNLMTLPNCVDDDAANAAASSYGASTGAGALGAGSTSSMGRRSSASGPVGMGALVSKTLSTAKKRLFHSPSSAHHHHRHAATVVIPQ